MQVIKSSIFALALSFASVTLAAHNAGHRGDSLVVDTTASDTTANPAGENTSSAPVMVSGTLRGNFPGAFVSGLTDSNTIPGRLDTSRRVISPNRAYRATAGSVVAPETVTDLRILSPGSLNNGRNVETAAVATNPELLASVDRGTTTSSTPVREILPIVERRRRYDIMRNLEMRNPEMFGREMTGREMTGREMNGREMTGREMTEREMMEREMLEREMMEREMLEREAIRRNMMNRNLFDRSLNLRGNIYGGDRTNNIRIDRAAERRHMENMRRGDMSEGNLLEVRE